MILDIQPSADAPDTFARRFWRDEPAHAGGLDEIGTDVGDAEFRYLADNLPTLCWMARADGYIVWYSRRCHAYCGTTPAEMEGWGWERVHDPAELPAIKTAWAASIASGEPFEMVFPLRGADGRFRPFLTRIAPLRDASGKVARWFGVHTEIGDQVRAERALSASEATFNVLTDAMPQMVWSSAPDGVIDYVNARWRQFTGASEPSAQGRRWDDALHPDDYDRALALWRHSLETGEPYESEYRLRRYDGAYRWTLGRALAVRAADGRIGRWIGTCTDVHDARLASERTELLSRELSHRIKNIFAVITGLIALSARREPAMKPFAQALKDRIAALGRAHEFARPHSEESRPSTQSATLLTMLRELLSPYPAMQEGRLIIQGDDVAIDDRGATPIALVFHELATNAAKYGALSTSEGRVQLQSRREGDDVVVLWEERGGPAISGPPKTTGFGTQLASMSVEQQLGGKLKRTWAPQGLSFELRVAACRLSRVEGALPA